MVHAQNILPLLMLLLLLLPLQLQCHAITLTGCTNCCDKLAVRMKVQSESYGLPHNGGSMSAGFIMRLDAQSPSPGNSHIVRLFMVMTITKGARSIRGKMIT